MQKQRLTDRRLRDPHTGARLDRLRGLHTDARPDRLRDPHTDVRLDHRRGDMRSDVRLSADGFRRESGMIALAVATWIVFGMITKGTAM